MMTEQARRPLALGCPCCSGGMYVAESDGVNGYRCHVGHTYTPDAMLLAQRERIEQALWTAVSLLEEQAVVHQHLATRAIGQGSNTSVEHHCIAADAVLRAADGLRQQLVGVPPNARA